MRGWGTEKTESSAAVKNAESNNATKSASSSKIIPASPCSSMLARTNYFGLCPFPADLNQLFNNAVVRAAIRFRLEIGDHPVAQHGGRNCPHIVEVGNAARIHRRTSL